MRCGWQVVCMVLALTLGAACARSSERAVVLVAASPVADLVRRIAGPDADVVIARTPAEAAAQAPKVKLAVVGGLGDGALESAFRGAAKPKTRILRTGDRVPLIEGAAAHPWLDPQRARMMVKAIAEELARSDIAHANAFRRRAAELDATLDAFDRALDEEAMAARARGATHVPAALAYFGDRYGLAVAPSSPSTQGAANAASGSAPGTEPLDPASTGGYEETVRRAAHTAFQTPPK